MPTELPKAYDPRQAQERWLSFWSERGYFHSRPDQRQPYTIVIPPPNVTGALHMGHALNNTLQDVLIRWRRMQGYNALWMPGTDHAGIATQAVVERLIYQQEKKTRHDLGRDELVKRIWQWKDKYETRILNQLRELGCSCDWERTRFTLDPICVRAVRQTFFSMFKDGLIVRGKRLVNWDTQLQTAVADDEIYHETVKGGFWTFKYPVTGTGDFIRFSTTRPETMLGDTAVAVHPDDPRYRHLIGKNVLIPLVNHEVPIIADKELVDPKLGTGAVKVTPAHDFNDYACGQRHNLPMLNILNPDGTINANGGPYEGLTIKDARERVVADMTQLGLFEGKEDRDIDLAHSDRSKTPIEPYLSDQWFVKMDKLAQMAMDAVNDGRVKFFPARYAKTYLDWLGEKRDWCISRQLWWGHRIPVWTIPTEKIAVLRADEDKLKILENAWHKAEAGITDLPVLETIKTCSAEVAAVSIAVFTYEQAANKCPDALAIQVFDGRPYVCLDSDDKPLIHHLEEHGFERDPDVLDTWFSSALWPHSTLGWPEPTPELRYYYPTSVLVTNRDIITLWVARMVITGLFNVGQVPFHHVYIHPKILDGFGEGMSKSKGNGVDPLDIIERYGTDALRFNLVHLASETQDSRMPVSNICPHCDVLVPMKHEYMSMRTRKVTCPSCKQPFRPGGPWPADDPELKTAKQGSERFEVGRNFANKIWNAARFLLMNLDGYTPHTVKLFELPIEDRWILSRLATVTAQITDHLANYRFSDYARTIYDFTWSEFCDWYVEMSKGRLHSPLSPAGRGVGGEGRPLAQRVLLGVLDAVLRLVHPIMPFVAESIWQALNESAFERGLPSPEPATESVVIAPWPSFPDAWRDARIEARIARMQELVRAVREIRNRYNVDPKTSLDVFAKCRADVAADLRQLAPFITMLATVGKLDSGPNVSKPPQAASFVHADFEVYVSLAGLIDVAAEGKRLEKQLADKRKQLQAAQTKLANPSFVERAPADVVQQQREAVADLEKQIATLENNIKELGMA